MRTEGQLPPHEFYQASPVFESCFVSLDLLVQLFSRWVPHGVPSLECILGFGFWGRVWGPLSSVPENRRITKGLNIMVVATITIIVICFLPEYGLRALIFGLLHHCYYYDYHCFLPEYRAVGCCLGSRTLAPDQKQKPESSRPWGLPQPVTVY